MWSDIDLHARRGLTLALDRLEPARIANTEIDWFVSAAEAIFWLMLADELSWGTPGYEHHRDHEDPRGPVLHGFRYLFNLFKHYPITAVIDFASGAGWPWRFPVVWQEAHWKALKDLPDLDPNYRDRAGTRAQAAAYDKWLAGKLVKETIPGTATFFDCRPSAYH
jgi:hypothetical protein